MPATSVEETIYTILTTDAAFMTAIGGSLYWRHAPVGATVPYVVFWQVDDPRTKERLCVYGGEARASQTVVEKAREIRGTTNGLRLHAAVANVLTLPNVDDVAHRAVDWIVRYTEET